MSTFISPYKSTCIYCSDEVSVCSFLGYQSRIPVDKSLAISSCSSSEDLGTGNASSKRSFPSQGSRQTKKPKSSLKGSSFKKTGKCQKQRPNSAMMKALQQKQQLDKESERTPEPFFKAIILREMIRLGRQPKIMTEKTAKSTPTSRKYSLKKSCKVENLSAKPADQMQILFGTQENAVENLVKSQSLIIKINEVPRTTSSEHEIQIHIQGFPQQLENLGSADTELKSSLMDLDEAIDVDEKDDRSPGIPPNYVLEEADDASDDISISSSQRFLHMQ
ncbi:uncharacterized protein LOC108032777 [Drosophila biarmipes]|uniref:uncharacterized protein LOC108032777 n=1 Tax=Drosophila biarmipes TaxID=125945 RepID=UPI0007E6C18E|nr:uncharacterized protein LOC108032777 [Drosophila biarmipes]